MFDNKKFENKYIGTNWEILQINETEVKLRDNKKNIYYVNNYVFLTFIFNNKISITNNSFVFDLVIDNKNNMCTNQEYYDWLNTIQINQSNKINYNDLKVGFVYQLDTKTDYFIYLGKKWTIKYKYNSKNRKIELSKPKQEHICMVTYKHNNFNIDQVYSKNKFSLSKQKIIKEIGEYNKNKFSIEMFIENLIVSSNYLYFDDKKPKSDLDLCFKEVDLNYLKEVFNSSNSSFITLFHKSGDFYIKNNYGIYKEATDLKDDSFQRQISKSDYNEVIFYEPFENELKCFDDKKEYYDYNTKLNTLTERCENEHFRIAPKNYFILILK